MNIEIVEDLKEKMKNDNKYVKEKGLKRQ